MLKRTSQHAHYIELQLKKPLSSTKRERIWRYHLACVRDFQHERLIHLIVTCFVGVIAMLSVSLLLVGVASPSVAPALALLSAILLAVEMWYLWYYYRLENAVQRLYHITYEFEKSEPR